MSEQVGAGHGRCSGWLAGFIAAAIGVAGAGLCAAASEPPAGVARPSDDAALASYVHRDDSAFAWTLHSSSRMDGFTVHQIRLTSQRWRPDGQVSHPVWKHWLTVVVPDQRERTIPMLMIGGGRHRDEPPKGGPELAQLAVRERTVLAHLDNVPNQPMSFEGEPRERFEDDLVAHTWNLMMRDGDPDWLARFAMVKAVVRAMDVLDAFLPDQASRDSGDDGAAAKAAGFKPEGYFVFGGSKRGWTTWLVGAVDTRVKGIAPLVIDVLDLPKQTEHHYAGYGFWAPALKDYQDAGIVEKFGTPALSRVYALDDPINYLDEIGARNLPQYIVTATGDQFFPTDSARFYIDRLPDPWRLRSIPNTGHSLRETDALREIGRFYRAVVAGEPLPRMDWEHHSDAKHEVLTVSTSERPASVRLWQVTNPKARDFRVDVMAAKWTSTTIEDSEDAGKSWRVEVPRAAEGWTAFLVECRFGTEEGDALVFTTRVFVTPDTLPHAGKRPAP